jgi:4-amino-4-deoxy-L-arabinose transferase-like glycosyltransferase
MGSRVDAYRPVGPPSCTCWLAVTTSKQLTGTPAWLSLAATVCAGVYLMSPMLHSLTRNVSEDSVIAMIVGLCITHLFLHDYK